MSFSSPWALACFLLIPIIFLISRGQLLYLSPWRRDLALVLRLVLFSLLVLALAEAEIVSHSDDLSVVFLVDYSDSVGPGERQAMHAFIHEALTQQSPTDTAAIVVFGAKALVEESLTANAQALRTRVAQTAFSSSPDTSYTNLAAAIRLGSAIFPADKAMRLVLLSDGKNNQGDAKSAARLAAANGVELLTFQPPRPDNPPEVGLAKLKVADTLRVQEPVNIELDIESNLNTQTEIQIYVDGQLIIREQRDLHAGLNPFIFSWLADSEGFSTFQGRLAPTHDTQAQNNRLDAFSFVEGARKVLIVAPDPAEVTNLVPALQPYGIQPVPIIPSQMRTSLIDLSQYASLILVNLPAFALSPKQLDLIQGYVRDLGGGLVVIGGAESYGVGGYFETPLEETLPLDMALKDEERLPGLSMVLVIDQSGSMTEAGTPGGPTKVDLAKEAINRTLGLLTPFDSLCAMKERIYGFLLTARSTTIRR